MKIYFLITFLFLIQFINNLSFKDFLESFMSTIYKEKKVIGACFNDDFTKGINIMYLALNEKNNKKFTLGFVSTIMGVFNCFTNYKDILNFIKKIMEISNFQIEQIDFEIIKEILSNLINAIIDESGNYITYGEAIGNAILQFQEMLEQ